MQEKKERDRIDDLFKAKLYDFESDFSPMAWEKISSQLPETKVVLLRKRIGYWAAAASFLLLIGGGITYFSRSHKEIIPIVETLSTQITEATIPASDNKPIKNTIASADLSSPSTTQKRRTLTVSSAQTVIEQPIQTLPEEEIVLTEVTEAKPQDNETTEPKALKTESRRQTKALSEESYSKETQRETPKTEKKNRRWNFGTGAGAVSGGSSTSINSYAFKNTQLTDMALTSFNSPYFNEELPKTNIRHKTPFSWGLGASYSLNNRWSLHSGLTYSYLSSEWETNGAYHSKTKQKLHFIGLPLSINYKIAEWNRFRFYASAGAMTELNVAGKVDSKTYKENHLIAKESNHIRMKPLLWSVNSRLGVSYPLVRVLSVYAEVGADYYFDNESPIETIRSEKPFNVNLQAGFRIGF